MSRSLVKRFVLAALGLWLLAALGLGAAWLHSGWRRLDTLPTPDLALAAPFRPYAEHGQVPGAWDRPYILRLDDPASGGALYFFGSGHTGDPADPQIAMIKDAWRAFDPTLALIESRLGLYIGGLDAGVRMFGEGGAVYALARDDDVPAFSLEPDWADEIAAVRATCSREEVAAFYTMRMVVGERGGRTGDALEDLARAALAKRGGLPGLEGTFADLAEFDAWWGENLAPAVGDWRDLPAEAMWPKAEGTRLNLIAHASNRARDHHLTRLVIDRVRHGERVFVVCGASHALTIEPALTAVPGWRRVARM
ncbi:hypothetical protein KDM41_16900 [bacterium]|nr:hypothetical protein [bacterium]